MRVSNICLSDIPKEKIYTSPKTGKKYITLVEWDNDEPDRFGNHYSIQVSQTKEERASKVKAVYVGNGKDYSRPKPEQEPESDVLFDSSTDPGGLPF